MIDNSVRKVWTLTHSNVDINKVKPDEIIKVVRNQIKEKKKSAGPATNVNDVLEEVDEQIEWKDHLLNTLLAISPAAFQ